MPSPSKKLFVVFCAAMLAGITLVFWMIRIAPSEPKKPVITSPFIYSFNTEGVLAESSDMEESTSPYWWVNSGGAMLVGHGVGSTMQGEAPSGSRWRTLYEEDNPADTDHGAHPQNIFRLVTRSAWRNVSEEVEFFIVSDNFSKSANRNASNGLLLMSRYTDNGQTLYYAGIRVDGTAVIKKKYRGEYYTMAHMKVFPGTYRGNQDDTNLLPHQVWIGLRGQTQTRDDGTVTVTLSLRMQGEEEWTEILSAHDRGQYSGYPPILEEGYTGIRTDFMDVNFRSFKLVRL